jgi:hypothetical protein
MSFAQFLSNFPPFALSSVTQIAWQVAFDQSQPARHDPRMSNARTLGADDVRFCQIPTFDAAQRWL